MSKDLDKAHLVLADISGYTKFMLHNRETEVHGQLIINELMKSLLEDTHGLLEVSKLEGDAIFMYSLPAKNHYCPKLMYETLEMLPKIFERKKNFLQSANICRCQACVNIASLSLKVIVHTGDVLVNELKGFRELSGVDVIIAHRLLKNTYKSKKYLLLTSVTYKALAAHLDEKFDDYSYEDEDLGRIESKVKNFESSELLEPIKISWLQKLSHEFWKFSNSLMVMLGLKSLKNKL